VSAVDVVLPRGIDDPSRPSGGNTYDRRLCEGLRALGWWVREHLVPDGSAARAGAEHRRALAACLADLPDAAVVLLDGLVASDAPDVLLRESGRLRLVVLVHLPLGVPVPGRGSRTPDEHARVRAEEREVLRAVRAVVSTSGWTRSWLRSAYRLPADRLPVAPPGVDPVPAVTPSPAGDRLLCVGAVTPTKGQDLLVAALARVVDLGWSCTFVGATTPEPAFAATVRARAAGLGHRTRFAGPLAALALGREYARTDLLVAPSRTETYGMVVTEGLARGIPVVATDVGGLPESLGRAPGGRRPGVLVPPGDPAAIAEALRRWLTDPTHRADLNAAAARRRPELLPWSATTATVAALLAEVAA
jgi:glycosyltransferase involved in cell wall biosynthesis